MAWISTRTHGVLDLVTAGTLAALPRMMGWSTPVTRLMTNMAAGAIGYSLLTNYEFGLIRVLPMRAHLALDAVSGATLCAAPWMFPDEDAEVKATLVGMGLFELAAAAMTEPYPGSSEAGLRALRASSHQVPTARGYGEALRASSTSSRL